MNREQHLKLMEQKMAKNLDVARKKNQDYCGKDEASDPFGNFRLAERLSNGKVSTEHSIFTRMTDKVARIGTLLSQDAQVNDESIQDSLGDLANYALILSNYLDSKKAVPFTADPDWRLEKLKTKHGVASEDYNPADAYIAKDDLVRVVDTKSLNFDLLGYVADSHYSEDGYENEYVVKIDNAYLLFRSSQIQKEPPVSFK